jgi:hypothetical protein
LCALKVSSRKLPPTLYLSRYLSRYSSLSKSLWWARGVGVGTGSRWRATFRPRSSSRSSPGAPSCATRGSRTPKSC